MTKTILFYVFTLLLLSCHNSEDKLSKKVYDNWHEIEESTNYLDFRNYLLEVPNSENFEDAVKKFLKYRVLHWDTILPAPYDCFNNCADIDIFNSNTVLFEGEIIRLKNLPNLSYRFIKNDSELAEYPDFKKIIDKNGNEQLISKASFNLIFKPDSMSNLQEVFGILLKSLNKYRNELSESWYNTDYEILDTAKKSHLDRLFENRIVLWEFYQKQPPPPPPPAPDKIEIIEYDTFNLEDAQVILKQEFPPKSNPMFSCHSSIYILKNSKPIDSVTFRNIEALGGHFGLRNAQKVDNHLLVTKHGDYDGRTIIINQEGEMSNLIGGQPFLDKEQNYLFSIFDSDLRGFSIFDLTNDSLLLAIEDFEQRPKSFHRAFNNRYFITFYDDETYHESVWEFEPELERIMQVDLDSTEINSTNELQALWVEK